MWKKIKGWLCGWKFWVILLAILVGTLLFGSFIAQWGAIFVGIINKLLELIVTLLNWLAKVLNIFGWNGMLALTP